MDTTVRYPSSLGIIPQSRLAIVTKALRTGRPSCQKCCSPHEAQQESDFFNRLVPFPTHVRRKGAHPQKKRACLLHKTEKQHEDISLYNADEGVTNSDGFSSRMCSKVFILSLFPCLTQGVKVGQNTSMKQDVVATKIKRESLRKLKAITALKQETMLSVLERLIEAELERTIKQEKKSS